MLKVFFVDSYLMFLICFLFLPILHRYCLVLFVFFLLLLLLLCVFIYTVVPSSESFITKGFLMFLIAYLLPCRFDRIITLRAIEMCSLFIYDILQDLFLRNKLSGQLLYNRNLSLSIYIHIYYIAYFYCYLYTSSVVLFPALFQLAQVFKKLSITNSAL